MSRVSPNSRANHNAALVFTMLSACLVLLCGGTVPAQAQQPKAAARREDNSQTVRVARADVGPLRGFFAKLKQRVARGELDPQRNFALTVKTQRARGGQFASFSFTAQNGDAKSIAAAKEFLAALQQCKLLDALAEDAAKLVLQLEAGDTDVTIRAAFTVSDQGRSQALAADYTKLFQTLAAARKGRSEAVFYENTKALATAQEFAIVSRLPRAGLNQLLAQ
jgi:hypothetical protein